MSTAVRMCARCGTVTAVPVLIAEIHTDTGPGWNVYSCQACAPLYPPQDGPLGLLPGTVRGQRRRGEETGR